MKFRALVLGLLCTALTAGNLFAQDWAKEQLNKSPRHHEWVDLKHGDRTLKAFVVYPEVKAKAPAILVIHEIFGLTDWAKHLADELAADGYIAIVPDLLSAPGKDSQSYPNQDDAIKAVSALPPEQIFPDLDAAADYVKKLPACNGTVAVAGFCWGGAQAFAYINHNADLKAAYVFYGAGPNTRVAAEHIKCPVYGFYGGDDARVGMTITPTKILTNSLNITFEPIVYNGAGHGFMREGEAPDASPDNHKARDDAWTRWKTLLKKL